MSDSRQKLARAAMEIAVIIVGVLVAFQVDELREQRDLEERERAQIAALGTDVADNLVRLRAVVGLQNTLVGAQRSLLEIVHQSTARPSVDSIAALVVRSRRFHRVESVSGAYDALVASGDLRLIDSQVLRQKLAQFFGLLSQGYEDEELSTLYRVEFTKSIVAKSEYLALVPAGVRESYGVLPSRYEAEVEALTDDPVFSSYLYLLMRTEHSQGLYYDRLKLQAEELADLLAEAGAS